MFKQLQHTKSIVTLSFIILISLSIVGVVLIYLEIIKFSEVGDASTERKELVIISNTLASLYKAEGSGNLLLAEIMPNIRSEYDSLMIQVYSQIDSLRKISGDPEMNSDLDSVVVLLNKKQENTFRIFYLLDSVNKKTVNPLTRTTVLSKKDVENIDKFIKNSVQKQEDTVMVKSEKKSFLQRVKAVFDTQARDSSILISKNLTENIDSIYVPTVTDTIVEYVNDIVYDYKKRNVMFLDRLIRRQSSMHRMNEDLTARIYKILRDIESREFQNSLNLLKEKEITLKRSSRIAYIVSLVALGLSIIFLIIILRSLTYNQRYRNELEESKKYAEDLLDARERLILAITHDIKAPVSSIIGYIELLLNSKLPERERYYIENMQHSAEHVLELVKNLLDYHALDSNLQGMNKMSFNPGALLKNIYQSFIPQADKNKITFSFDSSINQISTYESDPYWIRQIVNNLVSNAIKFTPLGGKVKLTAEIESDNKNDIEMLIISVKDTGKGISAEDQETIFELFIRLENVRNIEGSGVGLAITKKLITLLKGEITLTSEKGKGSEFVVKIPITKTESKDVALTIPKEESGDSSFMLDTTKKILFIDDDIVQLNLFTELLKRKGFIPTVCQNSIDALDLIQKGQFDMIFTDIQMPDMNGFELVERIRMATIKDSKTIPVIALSGSSNISEQKFVEAGFSGFLPKPFTASQLMDVIVLYVGGNNSCMPIPNKKEVKGFDALTSFANDDVEASREIIHSFIEENEKNIQILKNAFDIGDWDVVKTVCHKMLPLMRMISRMEIVHVLCEFEKGIQDKEKGLQLIAIIQQLLDEARNFLSELR